MKFINDLKAYFRNLSESESLVINTAVLVIAILAIFSIGFFIGGLSSSETPEKTEKTDVAVVNTGVEVTQAAATTQPTTPAPTTAAPSTAALSLQESTTNNTSVGTPSSVADILSLYNNSANKVKTSASKVTKLSEDREVLNLVVPSALQSLADKIIPEAMADDTVAVDYTTKEDIKANFIVPGQDYVSQLTEGDISEATCVDTGTEYEVQIKVKGQQNPTAGVGVGAGFDVIEAAEITSSAYSSLLETFDVTYSDCVVNCKIDKATGNMTWASYYTPVELHVVVSFLGSHEATVGLSFLKIFTMEY